MMSVAVCLNLKRGGSDGGRRRERGGKEEKCINFSNGNNIMGSLTKTDLRSPSGDLLSSLSLTSAYFSLIKSNDCSCSDDV